MCHSSCLCGRSRSHKPMLFHVLHTGKYVITKHCAKYIKKLLVIDEESTEPLKWDKHYPSVGQNLKDM